jgi:hypothetical protein
MKEKDDILARAVESLKNEQVPTGPPAELADATKQKLMQSSQEYNEKRATQTDFHDGVRSSNNIIKLTTKVAAAAAVLVLAGYTIGRVTAPRAVDVEQLRLAIEQSLTTSLEPTIRRNLLEETDRRMQLALSQTSSQIVSDLTQQYRNDLNQFAIQTLPASNAVTNKLLAQVVEFINAAQTQDLKSIARAVYEIERNRLQDKTQLASSIENLAYQTEDQLQRTRQDMVRLLVNAEPAKLTPNEPESSNPSNERSEK